MLTLKQLVPAKVIDGPMLRGGHQPSARIVRNARLRPPLEGSDKSILRQLLGHTHIADNASEASNEPGGFDPPNRIDRGMCEGRCHVHPSHHLQILRASRQLAPGMLGFFTTYLKGENAVTVGNG